MSPIKELRTFATSLLAYASAGVPLKRLLDVGSGNGIVAYALSLGGAEMSVGIDPFCTNEIVDGNFSLLRQGIDSVADKWDLVAFHHSLEHVPNPREQIKSAAELLNPNGRIVVRIPTLDSQAWETFGRHWFQLDPPRHLFIPSRKGLKLLADQAGLKIVMSYDDSSSAQFWLSEHVSDGEAMTTAESGQSAFAKPRMNPLTFTRNVIKTIKANKASRGDQTCVVLARAN
jgi:SAM-dependent methyltransferase